jgi:transposase
VTALSPGSEKMSKYSTLGGDGAALLGLLRRLQARAERLVGRPVDMVVIQEAGLDGFWVHRLLSANGIHSHVVDPAPTPCHGVGGERRPMRSTARRC